MITTFQSKEMPKEKHHASVYRNNASFCYQSKEKVLSSNTFGRIQI